jgi:pyruvate formate lyase activating enzyme
MQEARFYRIHDAEKHQVRCHLCAHNCIINNGKRGFCQVRENRKGTLYSLNYGRLISENIDPIEKKPIFHLLPGSLSFSIATVGCNFRCKHCQNYEISQYPRLYGGEIAGTMRTPAEVVAAAKEAGCQSISYTYVEPTIFYEFAYDCAQLAHAEGIRNIFVSNGYTGSAATRELAPILAANNIDLKAFTDKFYKEVCSAKLQPVLDTISLMHQLGVWVEVTTLIIPGWNDSDDELRDIARFIHSLSPETPWHVTRFWPTYQMTDRAPTPHETLRRAREIGLNTGLKYVYVGNIPDVAGENTYCPQCGKTVIERSGFSILANRLDHGHCPACKGKVAGVWE